MAETTSLSYRDTARLTLELRSSQLPGAIRCFPELSPTERIVAMLIASGFGPSARHRVEKLHMSHQTYGTHRLSVFRKLGVESDVQLALMAVKRRYLVP